MNEKVKIEWSEKKNNDWIVASISKGESPDIIENVSINRTNTKGEVFPNFDQIMTGYTLECIVWTSPAGKVYLFAPKVITGASRGTGGANIAKAQEVKAKNIEKAQDNKELGIKTSSTIRMAVDLAIAEGTPNTQTILKWREWLFTNWDIPSDIAPPFK